jgi:hypothetical protein
VTRRQVGKLHPPAVEEGVAANEEGVGPLAHKCCEGCVDLAAGSGVEHLDLQPHGASGELHVSQCALGIRGIGRIDEYGHANGCRHQLTQESPAALLSTQH